MLTVKGTTKQCTQIHTKTSHSQTVNVTNVHIR